MKSDQTSPELPQNIAILDVSHSNGRASVSEQLDLSTTFQSNGTNLSDQRTDSTNEKMKATEEREDSFVGGDSALHTAPSSEERYDDDEEEDEWEEERVRMSQAFLYHGETQLLSSICIVITS